MIIPVWISFFLVFAIIIGLSKYELGIVLLLATLLFAILTQVSIIESFLPVVLDLSIIILAIAVALIPILGEIMAESGLMIELIQKMKLSKKASVMLTPAFFGLLPVAGGALMSAPILDQIDPDMNANQKVAINVWYRHVLIFIYPLSSALIIASVLTGIYLYLLILALIIPFLILILVGYLFLCNKIESEEISEKRDIKRVLHNFIPLLIAPLIDFFGRTFFSVPNPEIFLLLGLILSIIIASRFGNMNLSNIKEITIKMKIWRFPLLIIAMFWFLEVFVLSGMPNIIATLNLPFILLIYFGFFLGFATGRIQVPFSILIPIYLIQYGLETMFLLDFVFLYSAIFLGYLLTPIHPCLAYSKEFFKTDYIGIFKYLAKPTLTCFGLLTGVYLFIYLI